MMGKEPPASPGDRVLGNPSMPSGGLWTWLMCDERLHMPSKSSVTSTLLNNTFSTNGFVLENSVGWRVLCIPGTGSGHSHSTGASALHLYAQKMFKRCILFKMPMYEAVGLGVCVWNPFLNKKLLALVETVLWDFRRIGHLVLLCNDGSFQPFSHSSRNLHWVLTVLQALC